jgi:acyl-CoA thioester hydrolase
MSLDAVRSSDRSGTEPRDPRLYWRIAQTVFIYIYVNNALPYRYPIGVVPNDIDFMGHVNNANYLNWVQAAVIDHWRSLAPADAVKQHLWVALKHEITYRRPTFLGDDVVATVLLEKVQGARAFYETIIRRGEEVLAEVKSSWCCIDVDTLRPARLAREVVARFFPGSADGQDQAPST